MQRIHLQFPLRRPSSFDWRQDPNYSEWIQTVLLSAHRRVFDSTPAADHRPEVEAELMTLHGRSMSRRQAMLLYYLLAQCSRARDFSAPEHFARALEWCAQAEDIATEVLDLGAQVDLHELRGTLHRAVSLFWIAAEEFSLALRILREHAYDAESFDPEFEVTLAAKTATMDYLLANFSRALDHVTRAQSLLGLTDNSELGIGTIEWTFALLDRQRNELFSAFHHAQAAAEHYRHAGPANSTCRILSLAGEIALDIVEFATSGGQASERLAYLAQAADYIMEAIAIGQTAADESGVALATLSHIRLERVRGNAGRRKTEADIRAVLTQAQALHDDALLVAAETTLGAELLAFGARSASERWFRKAAATASEMQAPGLAFRAQRALRQMTGRNV